MDLVENAIPVVNRVEFVDKNVGLLVNPSRDETERDATFSARPFFVAIAAIESKFAFSSALPPLAHVHFLTFSRVPANPVSPSPLQLQIYQFRSRRRKRFKSSSFIANIRDNGFAHLPRTSAGSYVALKSVGEVVLKATTALPVSRSIFQLVNAADIVAVAVAVAILAWSVHCHCAEILGVSLRSTAILAILVASKIMKVTTIAHPIQFAFLLVYHG